MKTRLVKTVMALCLGVVLCTGTIAGTGSVAKAGNDCQELRFAGHHTYNRYLGTISKITASEATGHKYVNGKLIFNYNVTYHEYDRYGCKGCDAEAKMNERDVVRRESR